MEHSYGDNKLIIQAADENKKPIGRYELDSEGTIFAALQVAGPIQHAENIVFGLYTKNDFPLCAFGPFVECHIPGSKFIMAMDYVYVGLYAPGRQSAFGHSSFFSEDNESEGIAFDLKHLKSYWQDYHAELEECEILMMVSAQKEDGSSEVIARNIPFLTLFK